MHFVWRAVTAVGIGAMSFFSVRNVLEGFGLPAGGTRAVSFERVLLVALPPLIALGMYAYLTHRWGAKAETRVSTMVKFLRWIALVGCAAIWAWCTDSWVTPPEYLVLPADHKPTCFLRSGGWWGETCRIRTCVARPVGSVLEEITGKLDTTSLEEQHRGDCIDLTVQGPRAGSAWHHRVHYRLIAKSADTTVVLISDYSHFDH